MRRRPFGVLCTLTTSSSVKAIMASFSGNDNGFQPWGMHIYKNATIFFNYFFFLSYNLVRK